MVQYVHDTSYLHSSADTLHRLLVVYSHLSANATAVCAETRLFLVNCSVYSSKHKDLAGEGVYVIQSSNTVPIKLTKRTKGTSSHTSRVTITMFSKQPSPPTREVLMSKVVWSLGDQDCMCTCVCVYVCAMHCMYRKALHATYCCWLMQALVGHWVCCVSLSVHVCITQGWLYHCTL